jgi:hypothetical protein
MELASVLVWKFQLFARGIMPQCPPARHAAIAVFNGKLYVAFPEINVHRINIASSTLA